MSDLSEHAKTVVLSTLFSDTVYVALSTNNGELVKLSYARESVVFVEDNPSTWVSDNAVTFNAAEAWENVERIDVYDASVGGNLLLSTKLDTTLDMVSGTQLVIHAGDLSAHME